MIVKPNYEGSSMGIRAESVVDDRQTLVARVTELLSHYPAGLLCEEFVVGRDIVVPFLEKASPATSGVLEPAGYDFDLSKVAARKYPIYDLELKTSASHAVEVRVPAGVPDATRAKLIEVSRKVFEVLQVRDLGRIDYRVREDGSIASSRSTRCRASRPARRCIALGARRRVDDGGVLDCVVRSAADRYGIDYRAARRARPRTRTRVGLIFNLRAPTPEPNGVDERTAEHDSPETIAAIHKAIESLRPRGRRARGHARAVGAVPRRRHRRRLQPRGGHRGPRARVAGAGVARAARHPVHGLRSDGDRALARQGPGQAPRAPGRLAHARVRADGDRQGAPAQGLELPVHREAGGRGQLARRHAQQRGRGRARVARAGRRAERALPPGDAGRGVFARREFTLGVLGERRPRVLPPLEVKFTDPNDKHPVYAFDSKFYSRGVELQVPAQVDPALGKELQRVARAAFIALGCRDVGRIDVRLDQEGRVHFIECNPLPGLAPGFSDLCLIANACSMEYRSLIGEILASALRRMRERKRPRSNTPHMPSPESGPSGASRDVISRYAAFAAVLVGTYLFLLAMAYLEPITGDGWCAAHGHGAQRRVVRHDVHADARIPPAQSPAPRTAVHVPDVFERTIPSNRDSAGLVGVVRACGFHATGRWPELRSLRSAGLLLLAFAALWLVVPPAEALFYRPIATNYTYSVVLMLAYFVPMRRDLRVQALVRALGLALAMLLGGVIVGMLNEHTGPALVLAAALSTALALRARRRYDALWRGAAALGITLGFLFIFFAPAQAHRYGKLGRQSVFDTVLNRGIGGNLELVWADLAGCRSAPGRGGRVVHRLCEDRSRARAAVSARSRRARPSATGRGSTWRWRS